MWNTYIIYKTNVKALLYHFLKMPNLEINLAKTIHQGKHPEE
jgi:hypothetical protein